MGSQAVAGGGHRTCGRTVRQSRLVADSVSAPSSLSRSSFTLGPLKLQLRGRGLYMSKVDVKVKVQRGPSSTPRLLSNLYSDPTNMGTIQGRTGLSK